MLKSISKAVIELITSLERAGYQAYIVGGAVRDFLLNRKISDYDVATNATPEEVTKIFKHVIPFGLQHGTVIVRKNRLSIEVTTFRKKDQENNFTFADRIEEDLAYRDFTINALAMDLNGNIIDFFDGKKDIEEKIIRAVLDPYDRIKEDPLRMLRAIRFASQLGFTIEDRTLNAILALKERINNVAIERMKDEMTKLLTGEYFPQAKQYLIQSQLIEELPIFNEHPELKDILMKENKPFASFSQAIALLHHYEKKVSITRWIKTWSCSNKEKSEVKMLLNAVEEYKKNGLTNWLVYQLDESLHKPFVRLIDTIYNNLIEENQLEDIRKRLPIQSRNELALSGHLLLQWIPDQKPGPWMQQLIELTEFEVVMNRLENDEQKIKEWILCHPLVTN